MIIEVSQLLTYRKINQTFLLGNIYRLQKSILAGWLVKLNMRSRFPHSRTFCFIHMAIPFNYYRTPKENKSSTAPPPSKMCVNKNQVKFFEAAIITSSHFCKISARKTYLKID